MRLTSPLLEGYDLGYVVFPPDREHSPGYPRMDVILRQTPTGRHFDPQTVELLVGSPHRGLEKMRIRHPWSGESHLRVFAGQLDLESASGKSLEAFIFGGEVEIEQQEDFTLCVITSPAPIVVCFTDWCADRILIEEAEIILAKRQAVRENQPGEYERRLLQADPLELYAACLQEMLNQSKGLPISNNLLEQDFLHVTRQEARELKARGTALRRIEEIL